MKKILIIIPSFIFIILIILLLNTNKIVSTQNTFTKVSRGEFSNSNLWNITHKMGKGDTIKVNILQSVSNITENIYKVDILLSQPVNSNYTIDNINLLYKISKNDVIISNFYEIGTGEFRQGIVTYDKKIEIKCNSGNGHIRCFFIIDSKSGEHLFDPNSLEISYDIVGHFPYTANRFYDLNPLEKNDDIS